ncbi:MAG: protein-glutamate O-methyltransferase CheR [Gammaproteobacteria bacterium]|nr:protein-glutamate O-methyltransferase CheR [Gammaproteobacteria bacterium]MCH9744145.1 protein-glutamate O-methyltransferase CheR [Gammaproteobacteria bacterium]
MKKADQLAVDVIIDVMQQLYGYDFVGYSKASLKRRLKHHQTRKNLETLADMIPPLLNDPQYFNELLSDLSVTVTEMFRDPEFYSSFAKLVIPKMKTYSYIKIWHAGCATGEEVYSMAILLHEYKYLDRAQLYGTDFNPYALKIAKKGIYPDENFKQFVENYKASGGKNEFSDYFTEKYHALKIKSFLQEKITLSQHNLSTDKVFGEMEVIVCRNVMIYFDANLKKRVLTLFQESLVDYGFLCLGDKETLDMPGFKAVDEAVSIYQKVPYDK